jgi:cephalosporin hydroxylase
MDNIKHFEEERRSRIENQGNLNDLKEASVDFIRASINSGYSYNFSWMGRPIIQYPQDMIAMQELIWEIKPDLIIETGVAHGGSIIFYASLMELIGKGEILGIDIDIRKHNRDEIEKHPMAGRIKLIQGSSTSEEVLAQVSKIAQNKSSIMVCLDSNHTYQHVLRELELYGPFVSVDSYLVVFDTIVEELPPELIKERPWGIGNNPKTAVKEFLRSHSEFEINLSIDHKLMISVAPEGYLKRTK